MAILSITEAARAASLARSTVYRALKEGRLSATRAPDGTKGIDTAELFRVFGEPKDKAANVSAPSPETELLRDQVQSLKASLEATQEEKRRLWDMWEQAERERRALEQRLLEAPVKRGWWARWFRRK